MEGAEIPSWPWSVIVEGLKIYHPRADNGAIKWKGQRSISLELAMERYSRRSRDLSF